MKALKNLRNKMFQSLKERSLNQNPNQMRKLSQRRNFKHQKNQIQKHLQNPKKLLNLKLRNQKIQKVKKLKRT